jgi:Uma2 family endonuclease
VSLAHPAKPPAERFTALDFIPPLEQGDRLPRAEFERRYCNMPELKKAELIEGVVHMASPVSRRHGPQHATMLGWLWAYAASTPIVEVADNMTGRLDEDNVVQPDALLRIRPEFGGQALDDGEFIKGAPELVAEIAATSASYDLHDKKKVYRRNGVREYIVWRTIDRVLEWGVLGDEGYTQLQPRSDGVLCSIVFPGLWLDVESLLAGNLAKMMATVQAGVADPAHASFVAVIQRRD